MKTLITIGIIITMIFPYAAQARSKGYNKISYHTIKMHSYAKTPLKLKI